MLPNHSPSPAEVTTISNSSSSCGYDGLAEDCTAKLKGIFQASLQKVCRYLRDDSRVAGSNTIVSTGSDNPTLI